MIYIVAGNNKQADNYRLSKGLQRTQIFYISSFEKLKGITITKEDDIQYVGTCSERNDLDKIKQELEHCLLRDTKSCHGHYDDGDDECETCEDGDSCFKKGVV